MNWNDPIPCWRRVDLVEWAVRAFPNSPPSKFKKMKKAQLWAIYFSKRNRNRGGVNAVI